LLPIPAELENTGVPVGPGLPLNVTFISLRENVTVRRIARYC
jgi:hypothetical protein